MQQVVVGWLLDADGRQLARGLIGLGIATLMPLLLAAATPLALLSSVSLSSAGPNSAGPNSAGSSVASLAAVARAEPQAPSAVVPPAPAGMQPVEVARRYLGVSYVFGGSDPTTGLDCSGLVQLVFRQLGISLPRTAQLQYEATARVPKDQLQAGDLVFFARTYADQHDWITHVGIYIGGGQQIDAPTEGQVVSIQPVFGGFWGAHYAAAGRPRGA